MRIKRKVEKNLPQLIEWAMDNNVRNKSFCGDRYCDEVVFDENGDMTCEYITVTEIFTVEVEETVTEDTVIPEMLEISLDKERGINLTDIHRNQSINNVKSDSELGYETLAIHVINDNCTHTLIWTSEKGLVA